MVVKFRFANLRIGGKPSIETESLSRRSRLNYKEMNMKRVILIVLVMIAGVAMLTGCQLDSSVNNNTPTPTATSVGPTPTYESGVMDPGLPEDAPSNVNWVSPGKIEVGNFYAGATAQCKIRVHNGNIGSTPFSIVYRYPDNVVDGYDYPPQDCANWVTLSETNPILSSRETKEIIVTLNIPEGVSFPSKMEFWISIKDDSQTELIRTELCIRWLVTSR